MSVRTDSQAIRALRFSPRARAWVGASIAFSVVASACSGGGHHTTAPQKHFQATKGANQQTANGSGPFAISLSNGTASLANTEILAAVHGDSLSQQAIDAVLAHLPKFSTGGGAVAFKTPPESLPRPRVGATITKPFGGTPKPAPAPTDTGPLKVLRYQPTGDVAIAPDLSITFNKPMVPLGTLAQLDQAAVPVKVTPTLNGRWRWIGTRTLRFEFAGTTDRLPMATSYRVEVPAGTKSQSGEALNAAVTWRFRTPAPTVLNFAPENSTVDINPVFIATFDQRVTPASVLAHTTITSNGRRVTIREATAGEIAASPNIRAIAKSTLAGRWVAFRTKATLPNGASLRIAVGPRMPSAEGPRTNDTVSVHTATTYSALKINRSSCGFAGCRPGDSFSIEFNNALDATAFNSSSITITPKTNATIGVSGNVLTINAATKSNTKYSVRIPALLRDEFGQRYGKPTIEHFDVGIASAMLQPFSQQLITTDPFAKKPTVAVTSVGHATLKVDVYAVDPSQWPTFQDSIGRWNGDTAPSFPWPRRSSTVVAIDGGGHDLTEATIDLSADLQGATGHLVVVVSPTTKYARKDPLRWQNRPTFAWIQVTSIGVDAMATPRDLITWATALRDGTPIKGAQIKLGGTNSSAKTDNEGVARLGIAKARYLTATSGNDVAILPANYESAWSTTSLQDSINGFVFNDRGIYKPGETAHFKGWFRRIRTASDGTVTRLAKATSADWSAQDAFGREITKGTAKLNAASAFDITFAVPAGIALGNANLQISLSDDGKAGSTNSQFQIQEFRRPEFEVATRAESSGPHVLTKPVTVAAAAKYFAGGVLAAAPIVWQVATGAATYSPPNWSQFSFGESQAYWMNDFAMNGRSKPTFARGGLITDRGPCCVPQAEQKTSTYTGTTDASGTHYLQLNFDGQKPDLPIMVSANASATDVNQQSFGSNLELLVHPASLYVGIRSARQFVRAGEPIEVEAIVTDIDGKVVSGRAFTIRVTRIQSVWENGKFVEHDVDPKQCEATSAAKPVTCAIDAGIGGQYKVSATIVDDAGGHNRSQFTRWVSGAEQTPTRNVELQSATIVPNLSHYRPGDTAELLIIAPFAKANGLLTLTANTTTTTARFALDHGSAIVKVPITDAYLHGVTVQVDLAGSQPRLRDDGRVDTHLPAQPAFASAALPLQIDATTQTLSVTAVAHDRATTPGANDTIDVTVHGNDGKPVTGADVAVIVVDDAVLSLTGYKLADPIANFYSPQSSQPQIDFLRSSLMLANLDAFGKPKRGATPTSLARTLEQSKSFTTSAVSATGLAYHQQDAAGTPAYKSFAEVRATNQATQVRTDFNALALFSPTLTTDSAGNAHVQFKLPDNLTRYRVMAVAADRDRRFGAGESTLTARIPLQVRPTAPRFANFGDRFEFPVIVQNQTEAPVEADVVLEAANLTIVGAVGQHVKVPANNRVEVRFGVKTDSAGTATYRVSAANTSNADSAQGSFPVYTPVTTEAFATYGTIDHGAIAQPLLTPTDVVTQFGGLEVDTSSTAMQALTDAIVYLDDYKYESADAYASRIIALTSLRDVFAAFGGQGIPTAAKVDAKIKSDIAALTRLQRSDGGFTTWAQDRDPDPYRSVQATEAFVVARLAGFSVSNRAYSGALRYSHDIENHFPPLWDPQSRHAVSAYALHVRNRAGDRDAAKAAALYRSDANLPLDALAWLWPVVNDPTIDGAIATTIANRTHENPGTATFTSGYNDGAHLVLASDRRTDGIVLDALMTKQPTSSLIPKVVAGLIGNQIKGRWSNIQENGFILVALQRYFATYEKATPAFVARVWLGDNYAAEHTHRGRSIAIQHTLVPMDKLGGNPNITLQNDGTGRLYYRLGLQYAPSSLALDARDEGFVVDRIYEGVNNKTDVRRDADGTWHIKAGAMVRVKLTMVADTNHTNMALVDPLPAGLEALNPALASSPRAPGQPTNAPGPTTTNPGQPITKAAIIDVNRGGDYTMGTWFDHQNLRNDRIEAFSAYLDGGTYTYSYVARATMLGQFTVAPTRAEEIYAPEVFGRSASDKVIVG